MDVRDKERMDTIMNHIRLGLEHKDRVMIKITDELHVNFGRTHYRIYFDILNKDGSECYDIIPYTNNISWYVHHESYQYITDIKIMDEINRNIRKDYEWVRNIFDSMLYRSGCHVEYKWSPTLILRKDTMIKPEPEYKTFQFEWKDDILEEYNDVNKMIKIENEALNQLHHKKLGLAKEYFNRKNNFNVGDIVHMNDNQFAVVESINVGEYYERQKEVGNIEKDYYTSIHVTYILKSGKAKKTQWTSEGYIKGVVCKEKEFTKLAFNNNVKTILNHTNVEKLYNKLIPLN